jgi:hypothetical protein
MKHFPFHLLALFCLLLQPVSAQDEDDGPEIEIGEPGDKPAKGDDAGEDVEDIKRKNRGQGLGGQGDDGDDANAPKVKLSLQQQINNAIKNGVDWLKKRQDKDGSWGPVRANSIYGQPDVRGDFIRDELGPTAFAVYALAKCGEKKNSTAVRKGMKFVLDQTEYVFDVMGGKPEHKNTELQKPDRRNPRVLTTYESAAIVLMIEAVYQESAKLTGRHRKRKLETDNPLKPPSRSRIPKDVWRYMHNRIIHLTVGRRGGGGARGKGSPTIKGTQNTTGRNTGGWRYGQANGDADLSATQFVLLALRAASQAGYPVEKTAPRVWEMAAKYVRSCQDGSGGFRYQVQGGPPTGSMTACGVACLVICREQMELADLPKVPGIDDAIKRGLDWLDQNFTPDRNPGSNHHYYYLYGIERVGDLTGRKEFNKLDWYVRGARLLIAQQDADGKWVDGTAFQPHDVLGTTFALLFLKRATPPTVTESGD